MKVNRFFLALFSWLHVFRFASSLVPQQKSAVAPPRTRETKQLCRHKHNEEVENETPRALKSSSQNRMIRWYRKYRNLCETKPLCTKAFSQSVIGGIGSVLSQYVLASSSEIPLTINWHQVQAFALSGLLFEGPYFHWWFSGLWKMGRWLEEKKQFPLSPSAITTIQIIVDQTIGVLLFFPTYFFAFEILQSIVLAKVPDLLTARNRLGVEFLNVMRTNYLVWPFANFIIFRHVPEALRVLATSIVAVLWNAFLCSRVAGIA
mmetsp:Transcript_38230/g.79507  ORF Transcript_38230/g.79507 Transcript_38230/m.79507 type:complete len:262 (-) Transcript_38230:6535-7320(-)